MLSLHVNLGHQDENMMMKEFGRLSADCHRWGMPLLAMIYVRGHEVKEKDPEIIRR